jgi:CubicO group peptidase (beta-lactamase class C family)
MIQGRVTWRQQAGGFTLDQPVDIASLTKTMAAVLVMQDAAAGRLSLHTSVPGLPGIELRHLLSHTSHSAGSSFQYNNQRYGVAGAILEERIGVPFAELLRERVFLPAGMRHTSPSAHAISGVNSTVDDLIRYAAALDDATLLPDSAKRIMWRPFRPGLPYGLGWFTQCYGGETVAWHYGLHDAASALIVKVPSRRANLVMLANGPHMLAGYPLELGDVTVVPAVRQFLREALAKPLAPSRGPRRIPADSGLTAIP